MYIHDLPKEAGILKTIDLVAFQMPQRRLKVNIAALGDVGTTMLTGLRLLGGDCLDRCGMYDINKANLERLEMEMNQIIYPDGSVRVPPVEIVTEETLFDCDVFIFCAAKAVPPVSVGGDVRMAQYEANKGLVKHFACLARERKFSGLTCIVSDPVDPLCRVFLKEAAVPPGYVQGFGLGVMYGRALYYAEKNGIGERFKAEGRVYGPHGADLVVADSLKDYDDELSRQLTERVVTANLVVRDLGYKPYIAPALSSAALSILYALRGQWHYGSVWLGDEERGAFMGVRNRFISGHIEYEDPDLPDDLYRRICKAYLALCTLP